MISHEQKSLNNFSLFIALIKNEDIPDMETILTSGTDVDTTNSIGSTPIHASTRKCRKDIIDLLSDKGACLLKRNKGDMPVYNTKTLDTKCIKKIIDILEVSTTKQEALMSSSHLSVSKRKKERRRTNSNNKKTKTIIAEFLKEPGTSGVRGQLYETYLLSLVFLRAMTDKDIEKFYLATNIKNMKPLDDICCKYKLKGKPESVVFFLQAKHKDRPDNGRFTVNDIRKEGGGLYLPKYFKSFLRIISNFDPRSNDPLYRDELENVELNFIIYTPAIEYFESKLVDKNLQSEKISKMINTSSNGVIFQFKYGDNDLELLTKAIIEYRLEELGGQFLEFIILKNNRYQFILSNKLIQQYHVLLGQKVVSISEDIISNQYRKGKFRAEFFETDDCTLIFLRDVLFKNIVQNYCQETNFTKEEIIKYLQQLKNESSSYALSKLIGSLVVYDETHKILKFVGHNILKDYFMPDEINKIKEDVRDIQANSIIIHEAVQMAGKSRLESIEFKLPISFGNLDLTIRKDKLNKRLDFIVKALQGLLIKNREKKVIEIDDSCVGQKTEKDQNKLESGIFDINGGIGGAVGTLLVHDEKTKNLRFTSNTYLPPNAKLFLDKLKNVVPEGENLADYRLHIKLKTFPRASFSDVEDEKLATQFLSRLWFYTNEAQEDQVEAILKEEIDKYYNAYIGEDHFSFRVHSDAIHYKFHDQIQKWWKQPSHAPYLTNESILLDIAKKYAIDRPLVTVLNNMYDSEIKKIGIKFSRESVTALNLENYRNGIVNVITEANILSGIKIKQYYENCNNYAFISFDYVLGLPINDYNTLLSELRDTKLDVLVIMYDLTETIKELSEKLLVIINEFKGNKIIIVTDPILETKIKLHYPDNYHAVRDESNNLLNVTEKCENKFLEDAKIIFQGDKVLLKLVIDGKSKAFINARILHKMVNKEKIELGKAITNPKYEDIKENYIDRHIKRGGEKFLAKSLGEIDHQVVVITAQPDMGKSTLLTHLAVVTKKKQPYIWIVRINFLEYIETFNEWQMNRTHVDKMRTLKLLCIAALKGVDSKSTFDLCEINNEIVLTTYEGLRSSTVLEIELFLYYYNHKKKLTILFYGFDSVCPPYEKEVVKMLKIIEDDGIRMWISSNSNVTSKTALERAFGTAYTLEPVNEIVQRSLFYNFCKINLQLEKLNYKLVSCCIRFLRGMTGSEDVDDHERRKIPCISMLLHMLYMLALDYFQCEINSISSFMIKEILKQNFYLDLDNFSTLGCYLEKIPESEQARELASTPLHTYIAANYFDGQINDRLKIILNSEEQKKKWNMFIINSISLYKRFLYRNLIQIYYEGNSVLDESVDNDKHQQLIKKQNKVTLFIICTADDLKILLSEDEINEMKSMMMEIKTGDEKLPMVNHVLNNVPESFHVLFFQYGAAEYVIEFLKGTIHGSISNIFRHRAFWDFIVNAILTFCPDSVRNAFDYKLNNDPELAQMTSSDSCQKIVFEMSLKRNRELYFGSNRCNVEGVTNFINIMLKYIEVYLSKYDVSNTVDKVKFALEFLSLVGYKLARNISLFINKIDKDNLWDILSSDEFINILVEIVSLFAGEQFAKIVRENLTIARDWLVSNSDKLFRQNVDTVNLIQDICKMFQQQEVILDEEISLSETENDRDSPVFEDS